MDRHWLTSFAVINETLKCKRITIKETNRNVLPWRNGYVHKEKAK